MPKRTVTRKRVTEKRWKPLPLSEAMYLFGLTIALDNHFVWNKSTLPAGRGRT